MTHHVLHVDPTGRLEVLTDLAAAPGRTVMFTRTKRGAKTLARQLSARGVPAVELHGNLSQGARTRNLEAFSSGRAATLVATDIAARGIHVDDVGLVVHADPPVEHKAYLHRSGRTARAGASGTVVTVMLDAQVADVRDLTRKAGIKPTITRVAPGHALLRDIAPGERTFVDVKDLPTEAVTETRGGGVAAVVAVAPAAPAAPAARWWPGAAARAAGPARPAAARSSGPPRAPSPAAARPPGRAAGRPATSQQRHVAGLRDVRTARRRSPRGRAAADGRAVSVRARRTPPAPADAAPGSGAPPTGSRRRCGPPPAAAPGCPA